MGLDSYLPLQPVSGSELTERLAQQSPQTAVGVNGKCSSTLHVSQKYLLFPPKGEAPHGPRGKAWEAV